MTLFILSQTFQAILTSQNLKKKSSAIFEFLTNFNNMLSICFHSQNNLEVGIGGFQNKFDPSEDNDTVGLPIGAFL